MLLRLLALAAALSAGGVLMVGAQDNGGNIALTVYNAGAALIRQERTIRLDQGENTVTLGDVPSTIDPTSVIIRAPGSAGFHVVEQAYKANLANRDALFAQFAGETISVTALDGVVYSGELLYGRGDDLILRGDDGAIVMPNINDARDIRFPNFPAALVTEPTLQWLLQSETAGEQAVEITYLAGGLTWSADYTLLLRADESAFDLRGWVTLSNRSGASFHDARLKLIAGDLQRLDPRPAVMEARAMAYDMAQEAAPAVEQREFYEYQLYEIGRPVSLLDRESKQIEFVSGEDIPATIRYVFDRSPAFHGYYSPIDYVEGPGFESGAVATYLEFRAGAESGLDADLPGGRIRAYKADVDGAGLLIGESQISHTPAGEEIAVGLGLAFDLKGERQQTDFSFVSRRVARESFEIRLRNHKADEAVSIIVPERLYRWRDWRIVESSAPFVTVDGASIEFAIDLAPGAEESLTYTVEYNFPANY